MIKGWFSQKDTATLNVHASDKKNPAKYVKQKLIAMRKGADKPTITAGDFYISSHQLQEQLDRKSARIHKNSTMPSTKSL